jgi:hypothetical protein
VVLQLTTLLFVDNCAGEIKLRPVKHILIRLFGSGSEQPRSGSSYLSVSYAAECRLFSAIGDRVR